MIQPLHTASGSLSNEAVGRRIYSGGSRFSGAGRQGLEAEIAVLGPEHRGLVVNAQVGDAGGHLLGVALEQGGLKDQMGIGRVGVLGQGAADEGQARADDVGLSVFDLP